ncbi:hypothetical protein M0804_001760 [Polistes exclamans]|nr:hypothetical protein M0804_001760 [Polistes exclamans]
MIMVACKVNHYQAVLSVRPVHWLDMRTVDAAVVKDVIDALDTTNRPRACLTRVRECTRLATIACIDSIRESLSLLPS